MDYKRIYDQLIERARNRIPNGYVERHHVIPRCMGGNDEKENLVALYPEEHFVAHALLLKIYKETEHRYALAKACSMMTLDNKLRAKRSTRRLYGWLKREHALAISVSQSGEGNSQAGTMWVCNKNTQQNKKIKKTDPIPDGWEKGRNKWKGKKIPTKRKENILKHELKVLSYLNESDSITSALKLAGLNTKGANYSLYKKVAYKYNLTSKFDSDKIKWDCVPSWPKVADS